MKEWAMDQEEYTEREHQLVVAKLQKQTRETRKEDPLIEWARREDLSMERRSKQKAKIRADWQEEWRSKYTPSVEELLRIQREMGEARRLKLEARKKTEEAAPTPTDVDLAAVSRWGKEPTLQLQREQSLEKEEGRILDERRSLDRRKEEDLQKRLGQLRLKWDQEDGK
jgi:hypothetical protein